jgi:hypothetical protein
VLDDDFLERSAEMFASARSFMRFLCDALALPF